jgi:hypothetical protein
MININNPDIDPANNYTLTGVTEFAFKKMQQAVNGMLPAQVISYDRTTNRVSVQLLIDLRTTSGTAISRATLSSIPVLCLGGGNFSVSFPLNAGDQGWVLANDRDISTFLNTYDQTIPASTRMYNFADGIFYPDVMKTYNITESNKGYGIIQSQDGTISIEFGVNVTTGANEINVISDRVNIALNNTTTGLVTIDGNLLVRGLISCPLPLVNAPAPIPFPPPYPP